MWSRADFNLIKEYGHNLTQMANLLLLSFSFFFPIPTSISFFTTYFVPIIARSRLASASASASSKQCDLSDTAKWRGGFDSRNHSDNSTGTSIAENARKLRELNSLEMLLLQPYLQPPYDRHRSATIAIISARILNLYEDDGF